MRLDGGVEGDLRPSRNRTLLWEATAGAARVDALTTAHRLPYSAWVPVGSGRLGLMLSRMWELEGGYRRDFSLLQGVTDEVYATDTGTVTLNRRLSSSMEVKVGGSIENFRTPVPGGDAEILAYGTGVSWGYTLSGTTTLTTSYYYYRHHFSDTVVLPAGFPAQYDRHAVRVGLTVTWPFAQPRSTGGAR
jgi:hypothetical protein